VHGRLGLRDRLAHHHASRLDALPPTEVAYELKDSRDLLQRYFYVPVDFFCYPGGAYDPAVEAAERRAAHEQHLTRRAAVEAERGRPLRGRKPRPKGPRSAAAVRANPTDPDSRVMKGSRAFLQGYNAQAVVTTDHIVVAAVTSEGNDRCQLRPCSCRPRRTSPRLTARRRSGPCLPTPATVTSASSPSSRG
jgi:peptidoglycan/xylan/chitin deacetylase (PgdA/CDA1 family)